MTRIYTKTGDDGSTGLADGSRTEKNSLVIETCGEIDELNCHLGVVRTLLEKNQGTGPCDLLSMVITLQNRLFDMGAFVASPGLAASSFPDGTEELESWIDKLEEQVPELKNFILPGGTELNAQLHLARAVCRRAERRLVTLASTEKTSRLSPALAWLNRLSDLLFVMARYDCEIKGVTEYKWTAKS